MLLNWLPEFNKNKCIKILYKRELQADGGDLEVPQKAQHSAATVCVTGAVGRAGQTRTCSAEETASEPQAEGRGANEREGQGLSATSQLL